MLPNSDNTLGEMLARAVSKGIGLDGSTASLTQAITGALNTYGVPTSDLIIKDGSGLATDNAVPALYMARLFAVINTRDRNLDIIMDALPVAGVSGTLSSRFTGPNAVARGNVTAKTGWLRSAYSLSGVIRAADGTPLTFAFYSIRDGIAESAKAAQDSLAAAIFTCGDNLSNN
jgi:D-alanyl-D-alanine carboxypeptidase/D-alanyl-D-alanine-endopeptidase (penicillin-binding protein 4)